MGLPQTPSGLAHPIPNLLKWSDRSDICEKITERITHWYPEWKFRVEHVVTVLFVDDKQFDSEEGPLSVEQNTPPDLRDRLDLISPFCKHYMHHLDPENLNRAIWAHALHKPPVPQPKMSAEDDRNADWPTIARSMYWDSRFDTDPDLPTIAEAKPEEISKVCSRDKSRCVVTQSPEVKYFWFFPFTWNNSPPNNNATGNLESASVDLVDVDMLDSGILIAREIGNTHKSWNIMCIDRVLYEFVVRGWGGLRFEEAGEPNDKGIVKVKLRFYWMPQMTGRFNRECTNDKEMTEIANEFNAFVRAGCPPPPTYPKGEGFNIPKSGQLVEVERDACDVERFTSVVKIHWACVVYTALCGGAGRPQFMTGKDQSYGHLEPRDEQFAHEKARLEKKDLVAQMAWKKYYQPSDDSGHGGSNSGSSGDTL